MRRTLPLIAALVAAPAAARADAEEASLHVHLVGGAARLADADAEGDQRALAPLLGVAGRVAYATSDWFQVETALTLAGTGAAAYDLGSFAPPGRPAVAGPFSLSTHLARAEVGVTARLGVQVIPTVRVFAGAQARHLTEVTVDDRGLDAFGRDAAWKADLVAGGALGLDVRVNRRLIVGGGVGGTVAVPLGGPAMQTVEAFVHVARYWYPRF
jgi:hypothetical protein